MFGPCSLLSSLNVILFLFVCLWLWQNQNKNNNMKEKKKKKYQNSFSNPNHQKFFLFLSRIFLSCSINLSKFILIFHRSIMCCYFLKFRARTYQDGCDLSGLLNFTRRVGDTFVKRTRGKTCKIKDSDAQVSI